MAKSSKKKDGTDPKGSVPLAPLGPTGPVPLSEENANNFLDFWHAPFEEVREQGGEDILSKLAGHEIKLPTRDDK